MGRGGRGAAIVQRSSRVESSVDVSAIRKFTLELTVMKKTKQNITLHCKPNKVSASVLDLYPNKYSNNTSHNSISLLGWQHEPYLRRHDIINLVSCFYSCS